MTASLNGTFEVHADGSVSGVLKYTGRPFSLTAEHIRNIGFDSLDDYVENLHSMGYSLRVAFPSGAVLQTCGDKIVGRVEPEPKRPELTWNTKTPFDPFKDSGFSVTHSEAVDATPVRGPSANPLPANANLQRT